MNDPQIIISELKMSLWWHNLQSAAAVLKFSSEFHHIGVLFQVRRSVPQVQITSGKRLTRLGVNRQKLPRCISILATPKMGCDTGWMRAALGLLAASV
jgi:hypothetical protein